MCESTSPVVLRKKLAGALLMEVRLYERERGEHGARHGVQLCLNGELVPGSDRPVRLQRPLGESTHCLGSAGSAVLLTSAEADLILRAIEAADRAAREASIRAQRRGEAPSGE